MKEFDRFFVGFDGFDPLVKRLTNNYPPYNIKKIDENKYTIEMAVAGFTRQDIEIELDGSTLVIKGKIQQGEPIEKDSKGEWTWPIILYQGLANRSFTRQFKLADNVEIKNAELLNGILKIILESIIPEEKKPIKIEIEESK